MTSPQQGQRFRALHQRAGIFVMPNPWDARHGEAARRLRLRSDRDIVGRARLDARPGRTPRAVTRDDAIAHARLSARRPACRSTAISRAATATARRRSPRRSAGRSTPASPAARWRTRTRRPAGSIRSTRRSALLGREGGVAEIRGGFRADRPLRSLLPEASRIRSARRCGGSRPTRPPARTWSMRRA